MKVCWHYGSTVGKYVAEIGKLTLRASEPMTVATVSMTTKLYDTPAPVIISFKTAGGMTGRSYEKTEGPTQVKFLFTNTYLFEVYFSDFVMSPITPNSNEDDRAEATQAICGIIE